MTDSFAQAMVFFLVVLFGLGLTFPIVAYYKEKPKLKKLGYLFMSCFPCCWCSACCVGLRLSDHQLEKWRAALQNLLLKKVFALRLPKEKDQRFYCQTLHKLAEIS